MRLLRSMLLAASVGLVGLAWAGKKFSATDEFLALEVGRHNPCPIRKADFPRSFDLSQAVAGRLRAKRVLELPSDKTAPVQSGSKKGCYRITGDVRVPRQLAQDLQVYTELRLGAKPAPFKRCRGWDERTGCGGSDGSCLSCDVCGDGDVLQGKARFSRLRLGPDPLKCSTRVGANETTPFEFLFCLPTKEQLIRDGDTTEDEWAGQFGDGAAMRVYLRAFVFERDLAPLFRERHRRMRDCVDATDPQRIRSCKDLFWKCFEEQAKIERAAVGCHAIFGRVFAVPVSGGSGGGSGSRRRGLSVRHDNVPRPSSRSVSSRRFGASRGLRTSNNRRRTKLRT